eukprot:scaffold86544_cov20-Tisochrysis_lutea.AAC.1
MSTALEAWSRISNAKCGGTSSNSCGKRYQGAALQFDTMNGPRDSCKVCHSITGGDAHLNWEYTQGG